MFPRPPVNPPKVAFPRVIIDTRSRARSFRSIFQCKQQLDPRGREYRAGEAGKREGKRQTESMRERERERSLVRIEPVRSFNCAKARKYHHITCAFNVRMRTECTHTHTYIYPRMRTRASRVSAANYKRDTRDSARSSPRPVAAVLRGFTSVRYAMITVPTPDRL